MGGQKVPDSDADRKAKDRQTVLPTRIPQVFSRHSVIIDMQIGLHGVIKRHIDGRLSGEWEPSGSMQLVVDCSV